MIEHEKNTWIRLSYGEKEAEHRHQELELIYVLDGSAGIRNNGIDYDLCRNDILLLNHNDSHSITVTKEAILLHLYLSYPMLAQYLEEESLFFWCNSTLDQKGDMQKLQRLLEEISLLYMETGKEKSFRQKSLIYQLLTYLAENFLVDQKKRKSSGQAAEGEPLALIYNYIHLHYAESISLRDIAKKLYWSDSSLSRFFKKETGENFVDYVNRIRLHYAVEEMMQTDHSITRIAVDNGFATPSMFNRIFKSVYGTTPSAYKKGTQEKQEKKEKQIPEQKRRQLMQEYAARLKSEEGGGTIPRKTITADISLQDMPWNDKNTMINIGDAALMEMAMVQEQVLFLVKQLRFQYVRLWNLFSPKFMIAEDLTKEQFNFERLDRVLDFFVQNRIALFLDFGNRTNCAFVSGTLSLYTQNGQMEIRNHDEWRNLFEHFMDHLVRRYGMETLETWIFELSRGILPHYQGCEDYAAIYMEEYHMVKERIPAAVIAGPGLTPSMDDEEEVSRWIQEWNEADCLPDYFTVLSFPYYDSETPEELLRKRMTDDLFLRHLVEKIREWMRRQHISIKLCVSEWSNSLSNRSPIQDSCSRGTYIIQNVLSVGQMVDMMGFWYGLDWLSAYYDSHKVLHGGAGILTKDGICKPSFYALSFLKQLGQYLIKAGNHYLITRGKNGHCYLLCFNHKEYSTYYYLKDEAGFREEDLNLLFQDQEEMELLFHLTQAEDRAEYRMKRRTIHEGCGSVLNEWVQLGKEAELGTEEIQYLKQICIPKVQMSRLRSKDGELTFQVRLKPHEMTVIDLYKE